MTAPIHTSPIVSKFGNYLNLTEKERQVLLDLQETYETVPQNTRLIQPGSESNSIFLLLNGWAYSFRDLIKGERQILNYFIICDFIGLSIATNPKRDYHVSTLTESLVCRIETSQILKLFQETPRLALVICSTLCNQNELLTEQILRISKRNAYHRTGHFILEIASRLEITNVGNKELKTIEFPISQEMMADTLGMTPVHVNRTMRKLKKDQLIDYDHKSITILNRPLLKEVTEFSNNYIESEHKNTMLKSIDF